MHRPQVMEEDKLRLTQSLEIEVRTGFAVTTADPASPILNAEQLSKVLSKTKVRIDQSLGEALMSQGEGAASDESAALLDWIDATFSTWRARYPIDPALEEAIQAARPLAAAFACTEGRFFTPGAHALHRLLDTLYTGFAGWSPDLSESGQQALEAANEVMQRCLSDFPSEPAVDHTLQLLEQKVLSHTNQLARLDKGMIEREQASMASALAKETVCKTLSQCIGNALFPSRLAGFFGSEWFDAGIALTNSSGNESDVWKRYVTTTEQLIAHFSDESCTSSLPTAVVRPSDDLWAVVSDILRQSGASGDRYDNAVSTIEYLLLRHQSGQISGAREPVMLDGKPVAEWLPTEQQTAPDSNFTIGDWYQIQQPEGVRRLRLAGTMAQNQFVLFMDFTGARALRLGMDEFTNLLRSREALHLDTSQTFSRALVEAAADRSARIAQKEAEAAKLREDQAREEISQVARRTAEREEASVRLVQAEAKALGTTSPRLPSSSDTTEQALSAEQPFDRKTVLQLRLPIGTWLGFHDREPPIMARFAVRDLERDSLIFTNREGIKLRELTTPQLVTLVERDMVDMIEHKTSLKEMLGNAAEHHRVDQSHSHRI